jgi:hypothetical protein
MAKRQFQPFELVPTEPAIVFSPTSIDDLINLGSGNLAQMIRYHRREERRLRATLATYQHLATGNEKERLAVVRSKIGRLAHLKNNAPYRPIFPVYRPMDHFNEGDIVVGFVGNWPKNSPTLTTSKNWVTGSVIGGPSFTGTRYPVMFDEQVHTGHYLAGHGCDFFVTDPRLQHIDEFTFLLENADYSRLWCAQTVEYAMAPPAMLEYYGL